MCDQDLVTGSPCAVVPDDLAVFVCHFKAVDHHQCFNINLKGTSPSIKHLLEMGILEVKLTIDKVVVLIKCATRNEDLNHGRKYP